MAPLGFLGGCQEVVMQLSLIGKALIPAGRPGTVNDLILAL